MQNPALGCCCINKFVESYRRKVGAGPLLPLAAVVLPIVFHRRTVGILHKRHFKGGLLNAIIEHPNLGVGLQERMGEMFDQTLASIGLGLNLGMLTYNGDMCTLSTGGQKIESSKFAPAVRDMLWTADRLGYWMAEEELSTFCSHLNITF